MTLAIRDAVPDDAIAGCKVMRRSIAELCVADHKSDPDILGRWLGNKTPEIFNSWISQPGNSQSSTMGRGQRPVTEATE